MDDLGRQASGTLAGIQINGNQYPVTVGSGLTLANGTLSSSGGSGGGSAGTFTGLVTASSGQTTPIVIGQASDNTAYTCVWGGQTVFDTSHAAIAITASATQIIASSQVFIQAAGSTRIICDSNQAAINGQLNVLNKAGNAYFARFVPDAGQMGFFGAAANPVAQPSLTYSRTGSGETAALAALRAALASLGLIADNTTA